MYPIIWALKHAPCADIYEQMILMQMADAADEDGCNAFLSKETIADRISGDIDPETVRRKWRAMERRGLIRPDKTPPPDRYTRIPKQYRPKRWELCIPFSWWSDAQRERIQQVRDDRGLEPLTPETRPDIAPAPAKASRSDKGKPRPRKKPAKAGGTDSAPSRKLGDPTESAPSSEPSGATDSAPQGPLSVVPRGHSQWPNHPLDHPLHLPPQEGAATLTSQPGEDEEESSSARNPGTAPVDVVLETTDATDAEARALVEILRPEAKKSLGGFIRTLAARGDLAHRLWLLRRERAPQRPVDVPQARRARFCQNHPGNPVPCEPCRSDLTHGGAAAQAAVDLYRSLGDQAAELRPDLAGHPKIAALVAS
ncbi:hypothetical protein [Nocardiopsis sp. NPDC057823]|uniref:hypothetical protein n=1 Tax=Nocardiopsis sp. NPDC057823 TaxID=3346256 RepID=UPI003671D9E5